MSCYKLDQLILGLYQRAVLHHGVSRRSEIDKVESPDVLMGVEYTGAMGTMVMDEVVEVNKQISHQVDKLSTKAEDLGRDGEDLDGCLEAEKEKVWELEEWGVH